MSDNQITSEQTKSADTGAQNSEENLSADTKNQSFRGAAIHIKEDGTSAVEMVGITPMELYGALNLITEKVKKQLGGGGQ